MKPTKLCSGRYLVWEKHQTERDTYLNSHSETFSEKGLILSDPTDFLSQLFSLLIGLLLYKLHLFAQLCPQSHHTILMFLLQLPVKQPRKPRNKLPSQHIEEVKLLHV